METNYFTILWWFLSYFDLNQPLVYMCPPVPNPPSHLPPHLIPLGCPGALALRALFHASKFGKCPLRFQAPFLPHFELSDFAQHLEGCGPFRFEAPTLESTQLLSTVCNSEGFWRGADSGHLNALSRARLSGLWTASCLKTMDPSMCTFN